MTSTDDILGEKIKELEFLLEEKESDIIKAVEIGSSLLTENGELKDRLDETVRKHSLQVEALQQDIYVLQNKIENLESTENWYKEELLQVRKLSVRENEDHCKQLVAEKQNEVSKLQRQVNELQSELEQSQDTEQQLQNQIEELNNLLQVKMNQTTVDIASQSFASEEIATLQLENTELQNEITCLKKQGLDDHTELQRLKTEADMLRQKLLGKDQEIEEIQCQASSYSAALERSRTEVMDLKVEMEAMRVESHDHGSKGNSLFSEVEDRRIAAEKKLISLKVKIDTMKERYEIEEQEHNKTKRRIMILLQMRGSVDSERLNQLESQLSKTLQQKRELMEKVCQLEKEKNETDKLETFIQKLDDNGSTVTGGKVDSNYVNYLAAMLKNKTEEVNTLTSQNLTKDMLMLEADNTVFKMKRQVHDAERERDKAQNHCIKLKLKMEEMMLKYDPAAVKSKEKKVSNVEKIPLQEHSDNNSFVQVVDVKPRMKSNISMKIEVDSMLDNTLVSENAEPKDKVDLTLPESMTKREKSVSMSDCVTVMGSDGETKTLSDNQENLEKKIGHTKPKGQRKQNIKVVKADEAHEVNCKQQ